MGDRVKILKLKIVPLLVSVILAVNPLALCASAAVWEGNASIGYTYWGSTNGVAYMKSKDIVLPSSGIALEEDVNQRVTNGMRLDLGSIEFSSPVSIYISGYYRNSHSGATITEIGDPWDIDNYEISYSVGTNTKHTVQPEYIAIFTPTDDSSMTYVGDGLTFVATVDASESVPAKDILARPIKECGWKRTGANSYKGQWFYTSVRVIGAETSAELDELNNIAQQIVAGNETLEAMLGDVVGLLQQIYAITGDIEIAADRTADLLDTMLGYVDGIEGQLTDVYGLLSGFFTNITKLLSDQHSELMGSLADFQVMVEGRLYEIYAELSGNGTNGEITEGVQDQIGEGNLVQEGLGELDKIDPDAAVDNLYTPNGETEEFASVLSSFFENSLVMTMLMVALSMSFVAYVLYGKR